MSKNAFSDMSARELLGMTQDCLDAVQERLPDRVGQILILFTLDRPYHIQYGASCNREAFIQICRETIGQLQAKTDIQQS
jgi:hypothetical protein